MTQYTLVIYFYNIINECYYFGGLVIQGHSTALTWEIGNIARLEVFVDNLLPSYTIIDN